MQRFIYCIFILPNYIINLFLNTEIVKENFVSLALKRIL